MLTNYLEMIQSVERTGRPCSFLTVFIPMEIWRTWHWKNKSSSIWKIENSSLL